MFHEIGSGAVGGIKLAAVGGIKLAAVGGMKLAAVRHEIGRG